jgi:succinate-acetate transporter protein
MQISCLSELKKCFPVAMHWYLLTTSWYVFCNYLMTNCFLEGLKYNLVIILKSLMVPFMLIKVGDPLEKAAIKGIDWIYTSDEKAMSKK